MMAEAPHLLRPEALWLLLWLVPAGWLLWRLSRSAGSWKEVIDPALLPYLLDGEMKTHRRRGQGIVLLGLALAVLGIAGPSLQKIDVPVFQKADALVIVLDLSASMSATDTQPSRSRRARQKILDLLATRDEGLTGLVVYAGDAHVVSPLTDDRNTIENLLPALDPAIMPLPGSDAETALSLAASLLQSAGVANGQILLMTDGIPKLDIADTQERLQKANASLDILGFGTPTGAPIPRPEGGFMRDEDGNIVIPVLDIEQLESIASDLDARYQSVSVDNSDVDRIGQGIEVEVDDRVALDRRTDNWLDQGNWLALVLALGLLPLFRRGALAALLLLPLMHTEPAQADLLNELFKTSDQRGAAALEAGDAKTAAGLFDNSDWAGTAHYQAKDWRQAAEAFDKNDTADSWYNKANALAHTGDLEKAIEAYDQSLALQPDRQDALDNRELLKKLLEQQEQQQNEQQQQSDNDNAEDSDSSENDQQSESSESKTDPEQNDSNQDNESSQNSSSNSSDEDAQNANSDQSSNDSQDPNEQNTNDEASSQQNGQPEGEPEMDEETQAQMAKFDQALEKQQALEQWLRRVPDDPGGLLQRKFRYESLQRLRRGEEPDEDIRW